MALTTTTLSSAVAVDDRDIKVTSATDFTAGDFLRVDNEVMRIASSYVSGTTIPVLRGIDGTAGAAHKVTANVTVGIGSDWSVPATGAEVSYPPRRTRTVTSMSAAGAIPLPTPGSDAVVLLNGTTAIAATLANPTKDMDGDILIIVGNGKAAHTVTYTAGWGNAGSGADVGTFDTGGQCCMAFIAANGIWVPLPSPLSGTLTAFDVASA